MESEYLTILDEHRRGLILLGHQPEVERGTITHLIISIIQAASEENRDTRLDFGVLLSHAELGQGRDSGSPNNGVLQDHSVIDVADVLGGMRGLRAFHTEKVQDSDGQLRELAVLDELTEMGKSYFSLDRRKGNTM